MEENFVTKMSHCMTIASDLVYGNTSLIYYSHIPAIIVTLLMGFFVLKAGKFSLQSKILFSLCLTFSLWLIASLITWVSISSVWIIFFWSLFGILDILFYILSLYFFYVFVNNKDINFWLKLFFVLILSPFVILASTNFNISGFDYVNCMAIDRSLITYLPYPKILIAIWLIILSFYKWKKSQIEEKSKIAILSFGIGLFLFSVFITGYIADKYERYDIELYGLYAMVIFMGMLAYVIVKFKAFNIKLIGAQALVWALVIFIGSQFLYMDKMPTSSVVITSITLVMAAGIGLMIVRGIKKEIAIREKIETLADELEHTNERLRVLDQQKTQFVSLASHQLRAPLTAIKGYLSMILEGDYGAVEGEVKEMIKRVETSANNLVTIVGDFLDVSRIEQGKMVYEWSDFDIKPIVEIVQHELGPFAEKKGIILNLDIEKGIEYKVHGDMNKLKQVFTNLVDNSIKYTPKGEVKITLSRPMPKVVRFEIKDTGIGISAETLPKLFEKFTRADGANVVNVIGTGLGLFVAKEMVKAHEGGKIWVESEGLGKGSKFVVELKGI